MNLNADDFPPDPGEPGEPVGAPLTQANPYWCLNNFQQPMHPSCLRPQRIITDHTVYRLTQCPLWQGGISSINMITGGNVIG
jgi:hypothetical protein